MNKSDILSKVKEIKDSSQSYQNYLKIVNPVEQEDTICPDDDFVTSIFEECAAGLGFKYKDSI